MPGIDTRTPSQDTARLLRPWAVLERLRPVKLVAFQLRLREYERLSLGLHLIRQHFPAALADLVEHLLNQQMADGGWNCESYKGATHSSFHTTISVLEGLREYEKRWPDPSLTASQNRAVEFLLIHRLFRSDRTGEVVDPRMTRFSFPPRWRYDVIRVLDYFQERNITPDPRLADAIDLINKKRRSDGTWPLQNRHPGRTFFEMEKVGQSSRWNTLRALRVLQWYE